MSIDAENLENNDLEIFDFGSGYLKKLKFLLDIIFLTLELTPNADSFAESFTTFFIFLILDLPGL